MKSIFLNLPEGPNRERYSEFYWYFYVWIQPILLKCSAVFLAIASILLVWSESTFQITAVHLSIPKLMIDSTNSSSTIEVLMIVKLITCSLFQCYFYYTCVLVLTVHCLRSNCWTTMSWFLSIILMKARSCSLADISVD